MTDSEYYCASAVLLSLEWQKDEALLVTSLASEATRAAMALLQKQYSLSIIEVSETLSRLSGPSRN